MPGTHAKFSPSGAHRWASCPASIALAPVDDPGGEDARYGSAAHEMAALCITEDQPASAYVGRLFDIDDHKVEADDEMAEGVQVYVDAVKEIAQGAPILVEQKLPLGNITGEKDATGTGDVIIIRDKMMIVMDLKFGRGVPVPPEENDQLILYGLGALEQFDMVLDDVDTVKLVIHQPRIQKDPLEWTIPLHELRQRAAKYKDAAMLCNLASESVKDWASDGGSGYYNPGEKQCRWCPIKATCPALRQQVEETVGADFEDLTAAAPAGKAEELVPQDTESLARAMSAIGTIEVWCRAVRAEVERKLQSGDEVPGYKLVQGKRGNRAWTDPKEVEELLRKKYRLKIEQAFTMKLISPPQAEKILKSNPKRWAALQQLIHQPEGKVSVAHESDSRPAVSPSATADDFEDESLA